ncbi:MAG: GNAT family N-acetyltransferase [Rhodobacter sp.]|jgi:RimJ/RimL family protein N-acetyltransferase|nr:GNAT family N-acetyltransferase [Rhodobacter sp.]
MITRSTITLSNTPVLETERLFLRAPQPGDFEPCAAFLTSDRARFVGGPCDRNQSWRAMGHMTGHWVHRGFGMFIFHAKGDETPLGMAGPWFPEGWPEHEIAWSIWLPAAEGKGLAFEAATAARAYAWNSLGWNSAVSYIDPDNARSIRLAERMGAMRAANPVSEGGSLVYRHPVPEARQ